MGFRLRLKVGGWGGGGYSLGILWDVWAISEGEGWGPGLKGEEKESEYHTQDCSFLPLYFWGLLFGCMVEDSQNEKLLFSFLPNETRRLQVYSLYISECS